LAIVSEEWSNPQRRSLINFMVITKSGLMFFRSINGSGEMKNKDFTTKYMRDVILEFRLKNVAQIIINNATICKATCMLIKSKFLSIY